MTQPLSDTERQTLLHQLETLAGSLETQLTSNSDATVTLDQQAVGRVSRQDALLQQSMAKATLEQARQRLLQVRRALSEPEEYGECRHCGEPIGLARLQVRPETPLCLACQSEAEQQ